MEVKNFPGAAAKLPDEGNPLAGRKHFLFARGCMAFVGAGYDTEGSIGVNEVIMLCFNNTGGKILKYIGQILADRSNSAKILIIGGPYP